jgi:hypothetical protein
MKKLTNPNPPSFFIAKGKSRIKDYVHKLITLGKGFKKIEKIENK